MQSLYKLVKEMELKLHAVLSEALELKNRIQEMEEENALLRKELAAAYRGNCSGRPRPAGADVPGRGFINLLELYDQGFHICNLYFGRKRAEECLFCMAFLRKEQEPAAGRPEG